MNESLKILIEGTPPYLKGYTIYTEALQLMVDQKRALIADDWDTLVQLCNQGIGQAYGAFREMNRNVGLLHSLVTGVNQEFAAVLKDHAKDEETRDEFFSMIKEELLEKDPNLSADFIEGLDDFSNGKISGNPLYDMLTDDGPEVEMVDKINSAIDATVALAVRSLMGLTFANFQQHYKVLANNAFGLTEENLRGLITEPVHLFKKKLEIGIKKLHSELATNLPPGPAAEALMSTIEESLPKFGRIQATIRQYALFLKSEGKGTASEEIGQLSAMAGDLSRSAFASYAAACYLALQYKARRQDQKIKTLLKHADQLAYNKGIPNGKNTEISKVNQLKDGDFVEVAGFVESIETGRDNDGKLISQVSLNDPSSSKSVIVAGIYVHLIHIGLSKDAYCRVNGIWKSESGLNRGNPAIQIDKLSINDLASTSWKILFQDVASKFVDRWPGQLNIQFGLSPHESGENEGDSKILGAGELIYRRFIKN